MNDILARLQPLVLELQRLPDWPLTRPPAGLLLYDVLTALGVSEPEVEAVLGQEVLSLVEGLLAADAERAPSARVC